MSSGFAPSASRHVVGDILEPALHRDLEAIKRRIGASGDAKRKPGTDPAPLDDPLFTHLIDEGQEGTTAAYVDPIMGIECLAAYAPVKPYGWGVVVQHERKEVLKPVTHLRSWMEGWGIIIFAVASAVLTLCWPSSRWLGNFTDLASPHDLVSVALANSIVLVAAYLAVALRNMRIADR